jgi:hypothetical protein
MRAQALLLLLCAGAAALPAARAACQIDLPLASGSKLGVGGVFTFFASIPWPIWAWNKVPVTPSVRVTFPCERGRPLGGAGGSAPPPPPSGGAARGRERPCGRVPGQYAHAPAHC